MSVVQEPFHERSLPRLRAGTAGPEADRAGDRSPRAVHVAECAAWTVVWLAVLTAGIDVWGYWWASPAVAALGPVMVLGGIAGTAATWIARSPRAPVLQCLAFVAVLVSIVFPQAVMIHTRAFVTTDSAAFDQVSAGALLHGHNPYTASMAGASRLLAVPGRFWTYTVDGGHVAHASYPAGSFLVEVPSMALGMHHMVVDWTDLAAWVLCAALFFLLLPVSLRWLAGLLALTPIFLGMFSSGGTDAIFLPLLLVAVWRWDRFADPGERGPARWIGPLALGLACAMKQTPWFCVPLLTTGVAIEARAAGRPAMRNAARYAATVAAVFLVVNLPFLVWQPAAWARGTLLPFTGGLVVAGQGLVSLATHGLTGGVALPMLSVAGALAYLALLGAWAHWYPALKRVWLLVLPAAFFFAPRSLSSYMVDLFPVAVVAAVTVHGAASAVPEARRRRRGWAPTVALPAVGMVVASVLAFTSHPLDIAVDRAHAVHTASRARALETVTVTVRNRSALQQRPHFMVDPGDGTTGFWAPAGGRAVVLAPGASATVTLEAPVPTRPPQRGAHWLVLAYTDGPAALSTSALQVWPVG